MGWDGMGAWDGQKGKLDRMRLTRGVAGMAGIGT